MKSGSLSIKIYTRKPHLVSKFIFNNKLVKKTLVFDMDETLVRA